MMYGRLKNGALFYAPKMLIIDDKEKWFPTDAEYREHGYKPLVFEIMPITDEEYEAVCSWSETDNDIVQAWSIEEAEPTEAEILNILTGETP